MTVEKLLSSRMHHVQINGVVHDYWQHQRETLCGVSKIHRPRVWTPPTCRECLAVIGEITYGEITR